MEKLQVARPLYSANKFDFIEQGLNQTLKVYMRFPNATISDTSFLFPVDNGARLGSSMMPIKITP